MLLSLVLASSAVGNMSAVRAEAAQSDAIKEEIDTLRDERTEIQTEMQSLSAKLDANMSEIETMVAEKNVIDQEIGLLTREIQIINEQIQAYGLLIADKQEELDVAEAHLAELNEKYKERIRAMEENGAISYWSVLFEANSFSDLLDRLNMIEEIAAADKRRLEEMDAAAKEVAAAREEMILEKQELEAGREELAATEAALLAKIAETEDLLEALIAKDAEFEKLKDEAEKMESDLLKDIAQKEKEYDAAKDREFQEWLKANQKTGGVIGNTVNGIPWAIPCTYSKVSSPFGMRMHPVYHVWAMHEGVDLVGAKPGAIKGKPIYATRAGKVTKATYSKNGGYYVSINHGDGYASVYMHMTHYIVKEGQYVTQGQVIGYVGNSGASSTGYHLHFGISYKGEYVNPMKYIKK